MGSADIGQYSVGGASTISKMPHNFPANWPRELARAKGCRVFTPDGREYVDWTMGLAAVGIGYGDDRVAGAVYWAAAECGPALPLPHGLEERVAERLVAAIPCAEQVRFLKTGSEAAEAAIRVARAATGRTAILSCGYHSWHSWYAAMRPEHPGVPESMGDLAFDFAYNDRRSFHLAMDVAAARTKQLPAAIFVEPTLIDPPDAGFLELLRETATACGAVLIFDEVVTGFRWAVGGYQAVCGVTPDLATFGKAMGNGVPIAALVGRRDLMAHARLASGTFNGDALGLAAADRVLDIYRDEDVCKKMATAGTAFKLVFARAADDTGCRSARLLGQPQHPKVAFEDDADRRKMTLFLAEIAAAGVLLHPGGFNPSAAHAETEKTLDRTAQALHRALGAVAAAKASGDLAARVPEPIAAGWRPT